MTDWKDMLAGLQNSGSLPEGEEPAENTAADKAPKTATPLLTIFYEKKGRAGKPATIITGFNPDDSDALGRADDLARELKKRLGCGGSARGGEILIQGDRREDLRKLLPSLGYNRIKG